MPYFPPILSDPQLGVSPKDRNLILGASSSAWFKRPLNLILYLIAIVSWAVFMAVATALLEKVGQNSMLYTVMLWVVCLPIFFLGLHYLIFHFGFRPYLYKELHDRGYDICLKCGYILIDIPAQTQTCPECGTHRTSLPTPNTSE
jgi:hypothetical protein